MKKIILLTTFVIAYIFCVNKTYATHGLPLVNFSYTVGATGVTVRGTSDAATCGSGPYWMQVEIGCTPGALSGIPPAAMQTTLQNWPCTGGGTTYNQFPWYNSTQNIPNLCSDGCVAGEQYNNVFIPFTNLCPGQTYYFAAREWVSASNSPGPFTATYSFVVPGTFTPLDFNISASPATYCLPGSSTLSATGVTGGCGTVSYSWTPGGSTAASLVVSPGSTTTYSCTVRTPCNVLTKAVTVTVVSALSAAFTPLNATVCQGNPQVFTHTGTAGVTHNWAVTPATGVTIATATSTNPTITFANSGSYVVSHTVTAGACTNVVSTNVTVTNVTSTFAIPTATQCLTGNSFNFNNTGTAGGTHTYSFSPITGAPAAGSTANYAGSFTAPGTYVVTHNVNSGGCTSTTTMAVTVNPNPSATLTFTNPTCGNNNGVIQINNTSTGAQTISSFASSTGTVSGQLVTGLPPGTHVITLTNNFGCTFTVSATLAPSTGVTNVTLTPNNIICGTGTGSITIGAVTGGTAPYSYNVNGGAFSTTPPVTGLASGTYTIGVRDASGCTYTKTVAITVTPGPTAIAGTATPAGCGLSNGSYNITGVTGGTAAYTFSINGVSTPSLSSGLATGNYSITVRDANGCTYTNPITIGGGTGPTAAVITTTNASCGMANGSASVTSVTGGVPAYSYSFDGGPFGAAAASGLSAGPHTVIIRDAGTCTLSVPYNVANNGSPAISLTASTNVLCNGGSTGNFTVNTTGGSGAPYTYTLTSNGQTNGTGFFNNLPAGVYTVNSKDAVGCLTTITVNITQPPVLTLNATALPAKCFGASTGTITATGAGGTGTLQYQVNGTGYQASGTFPTMPANTHIVQVRDANGCTATQTVTVTQPTALAINISTQNANCTAANGIASSTVTGGTSPYSYVWTGGGGTNSVTSGVVSGTYSVTATDANGCTITGSGVVGNTPGGTAAITGSTNITCNNANNGILTANMVTAGTAPFTYSWSPTGGTAGTATNLAPGTYTCFIRDFYGCIATAVGTLTQPAALTAIMNSNNVKCFGTATGTVSASGSGGTIPYTYSWPTLASTLTTVNNVAIGTYTCQITDANNCVINPTIAVTQPSSITLTSSVTPANCNQSNGSTTITPSGGTPGYTYSWSPTASTTNSISNVPAGTYTVFVRDANNCSYTLTSTVPNLSGPSISITSFTNVNCFNGNNGCATAAGTGGTGTLIYQWNTGQITPTACNFLAGVHTVSVTDQSGCIASTNVTITQPTALTVSITPSNPLCFGAINGYGSATAFGGTPTYTYNWTGGGGNGATSLPLGAGSYAVNVTDSKGCTATATMALVNPPAMSASITSTNVSCFGTCNGAAAATTTNNIGIVTYQWIGGPSPVTAQSVSGLCAGVYTVTATDQNTCTASAQVIITQPTQVTANISSSSSVTCNGGNNGSAQVTPGGGTGAYTYTWTGAASGSSANANNLPAGTYTVTVGDANGCTANTQVTILQPAPLATTLTTTNPTCNGLANGTGTVSFSGGAGLPTFLWQPGLQSGNIVNNLVAGNHTVTITYNGSCTTNLTFTLSQPPVLTAVVSATNSNCGQSNGAATATVTGGTSPYIFIWSTSNTATTTVNTGILAGPHTFTVTDFNGCRAQATALVNDIAGPSVAITSTTAVKCFGGNDGAAISTITGGVTPYTIAWVGGNTSTTPNVSNFTAGPYSIIVTDAANCVGTASLIISQPTQLTGAITSFSNVTCFGLTNGEATMQATGGTGTYTYSWTPGGQSSSIMANVGANTYTCLVKDANNCATSQVVTITQPQALVMAASSFSNISCFGGSNGQISTTVQGGTPGYTYNWTPAQTNSGVLGGLTAGAYSVTVTDTRTCSISVNFTILEPSAITSTYTSTPAKCGLLNGSATVSVGGGTPSYTLNWNAGAQQGPTANNMGPGSNWQCVITDSKGCTRTQTVTIADAPSPVINSVTTTSPSCFGTQNGSIVVNYTLGTPGYTVNWSNPINPATQITSSLSQTATGVGAGTYTMSVTDSYGCTVSGFATVASPNILLMNTSPNQTICYNQTAQISATGSGGTPAYTYTWSPAFNSTGGPHSTPTLSTTTQYNVSMTDANGCSAAPKVITITVTPPLNITAASYTVCHNDLVALTPTMTTNGNGGPYTYNWSMGGSASSETVAASNLLTTPRTYTYGVIASDNCSPLSAAVFTVLVNPLPTATIVATPTAGCAPLTVSVSAISNPANTFLWSDLISQSGPGFMTTLRDSGLYSVSVKVTSPEGCSRIVTTPDLIRVYPKPKASFVANPQATSILDPTIHFFNTSIGAATYLWDFGDPAATNGTNNATTFNATHSYSYVGPYNVNLVATSTYGCVDVALVQVEITPDFALYVPNTFTPDGNNTNDFFQPMGVGINEDNYRMDIFDRWGEIIFTSNNFRKGWDGSVKGSGKVAEQGVYVYKLMVYDLQGNKHPFVGHVTVLRAN